MNPDGSFFGPPPMSADALPLMLRMVAGHETAGELWRLCWMDGVWRGAISATVVIFALAALLAWFARLREAR